MQGRGSSVVSFEGWRVGGSRVLVAEAEGAKINRENFRQEIKCRIEVNFTDFKIEILNLCISFNLESLFRRILGHVFSKLNSSTKSGHD